MSHRERLGVRALKLLAEESMVAVLRGLDDGALRPAELDRRLPGVAHSVVMRRLRRLLDSELVVYEHRPGQPPHARSVAIPHEARYDLTDAGRLLLGVSAEASRWEQTWCAQDERREPVGALAIKLTADEHTRKLGLLLADGPLSPKDLGRRGPELCRSALQRRLRELVLAGLLDRRPLGRSSLYELTSRARHLAHVAMLAGRWEWQWSRRRYPALGRDLDELLHLVAPVAQIAVPFAGICQLRLDAEGADAPNIYLAARAGSILALSGAPAAAPAAVGSATPAAWCETLLRHERSIMISGDENLLVAVIGALSRALLA
jgi:DNA-binding HxlR family transcriptional regulator